MLWIALHLPWLSLETFAATLPLERPTDTALALVDAHHIVSANAAARALGVKPGLKRATALALAPQITLGQAHAARDMQALQAVAHAALAFTPQVCIEPSAEADAAPLGHRVHSACAATPLGAALLARVHREFDGADLPATRAALAAAPVWLLGPGRAHWEALQGMGLPTIADLGSVPRAGRARRFGDQVLGDLDRAMGRRPDPREAIVPPPAFDTRLELFARADTGEQLLHGAAVLLARRDSAHLLALLREGLAQLTLPPPRSTSACMPRTSRAVRRPMPNRSRRRPPSTTA